VPVSAFAEFRGGDLGRGSFGVRRRRSGSAGLLLSADDNDRRPRCDFQWQGVQRLLGLRLRSPVLPAMFDFAVAAAVLFAGELPQSASAARCQVRQFRACFAAAGLVTDERARRIPAGRRSYYGCRTSGSWQRALEVNRSGPIQSDKPRREAGYAEREAGLDRPVILSCRWFAKNRHAGSMGRLESESS
jgi:hypothetical protein